MDIETVHCSHCRREVSSANYIMHEAHCRRHIAMCVQCNEPIFKTEMNEHMTAAHTRVTCPLCGAVMDQACLQAHEEFECLKRQVMCDYCELEFPLDKLADHSEYCGSRTQHCDACKQYVMLKDWGAHAASGCRSPKLGAAQLTSKGDFYTDTSVFFRRDALDRGDNYFVADEMSRITSDAENALFGYGRTEADAGHEPMFPSVHPIYSDQTNEYVTDGGYDREWPPPSKNLFKSDHSFQSMVPYHASFGSHQNMIPCEFCAASHTLDSIVQHQAMCEASLTPKPADHNIATGDVVSDGHDPWWCHNNSSKMLTKDLACLNLNDKTYTPEFGGDKREMTLLPCEFCGSLLSTDAFIQHQEACDADLVRHGVANLAVLGDNRSSAAVNDTSALLSRQFNDIHIRNDTTHLRNDSHIRNDTGGWAMKNVEPTKLTKKVANQPIRSSRLNELGIALGNDTKIVAAKNVNITPAVRLSKTDRDNIAKASTHAHAPMNNHPFMLSGSSMLASGHDRTLNGGGVLVPRGGRPLVDTAGDMTRTVSAHAVTQTTRQWVLDASARSPGVRNDSDGTPAGNTRVKSSLGDRDLNAAGLNELAVREKNSSGGNRQNAMPLRRVSALMNSTRVNRPSVNNMSTPAQHISTATTLVNMGSTFNNVITNSTAASRRPGTLPPSTTTKNNVTRRPSER